MKHRILLVIAFIAFMALGVNTIAERNNKLKFQEIQIKSKSAEIQQLEIDYEHLDKKQKAVQESHDASQAQIQKLQKEKSDLLKRQQELEQELSVKKEAQRIAASKLNIQFTATASAASGCNTGNQFKDYIYMHESGCNPAAVNASGCRGLGQACPGDKLPCGADFACQDAYFTNYALGRYGSWEAAYNFWVANRWW